MTESERGVALIGCAGFGLVTYAGYLASTGGDLTLALTLLTVGMIPCVAHILTSELKLGLMKTVLTCVLWTIAYPALVILTAFALSFRWEQDAWFIQPVLHWGAIVLTVVVGASTLIILISVLVQEIMDQMRGNRRRNVI